MSAGLSRTLPAETLMCILLTVDELHADGASTRKISVAVAKRYGLKVNYSTISRWVKGEGRNEIEERYNRTRGEVQGFHVDPAKLDIGKELSQTFAGLSSAVRYHVARANHAMEEEREKHFEYISKYGTTQAKILSAVMLAKQEIGETDEEFNSRKHFNEMLTMHLLDEKE